MYNLSPAGWQALGYRVAKSQLVLSCYRVASCGASTKTFYTHTRILYTYVKSIFPYYYYSINYYPIIHINKHESDHCIVRLDSVH